MGTARVAADYARTLREWQRRFEATFDADIVPALKEAYPELRNSPEGVQVFKRKWICEPHLRFSFDCTI